MDAADFIILCYSRATDVSFPPGENRLLLAPLILKPTIGHHPSQLHSPLTLTVIFPKDHLNVFTPSPWSSNGSFLKDDLHLPRLSVTVSVISLSRKC
jgi:hypothetical protein